MGVRASLWRRVVAKFFDQLALTLSVHLPAVLLVTVALVFEYDPFAGGFSAEGQFLANAWVLTALAGLAVGVLFEALALTSKGSTRGKALMSLRVVSCRDDSSVTLEQAVLRSVLPILAAVVGMLSGVLVVALMPTTLSYRWNTFIMLAGAVLAWLICHLSAVVDAKGRGWHDKAADTIITQTAISQTALRRLRRNDYMNQRWQHYLHGTADKRAGHLRFAGMSRRRVGANT